MAACRCATGYDRGGVGWRRCLRRRSAGPSRGARVGLFKNLTRELDELKDAVEVIGAAIEEDERNVNAYLHQFHAEIVRDTDIESVRRKLVSERADSRNPEYADAWHDVSLRCAEMAAIRLGELAAEAETNRQQRAKEEAARVARLQREAGEAETRRATAERATLQAEQRRRELDLQSQPRALSRTTPSARTAPPAGPPGRAECTAAPSPTRPAPPAAPSTTATVPRTDVPAMGTLTGRDIKCWREKEKLSQREAAVRLGVSHGTVGKAEAALNALLAPALQEALSRMLLP